MGYRNRVEAGRRLAKELGRYRDGDVVVLGLARGGVPLAVEVAQALKAPLDVVIARKVGVPGATHAFDEPGALSRVAESATAWFTRHLTPDKRGPEPVHGATPHAHMIPA